MELIKGSEHNQKNCYELATMGKSCTPYEYRQVTRNTLEYVSQHRYNEKQ